MLVQRPAAGRQSSMRRLALSSHPAFSVCLGLLNFDLGFEAFEKRTKDFHMGFVKIITSF